MLQQRYTFFYCCGTINPLFFQDIFISTIFALLNRYELPKQKLNMDNILPDTFIHSYMLTAGESDATAHMPLTLLVERVIEVATEHANTLGIGYSTLVKQNMGWVLCRISIEMKRYPEINEQYALTTWIESYNRRFSLRNMHITGGDGSIIGYVRTVWAAIDFDTRTMADLTSLPRDSFPTAALPCPIEVAPRLPEVPFDASFMAYTFRFCDLDFNRHVNTVRYVALLLNQWPLSHYDTCEASRFDIFFKHECHFGEQVDVATYTSDTLGSICNILHQGTSMVEARFRWSPRQ